MDARLIGSDSAHGAESSTDDRWIQAEANTFTGAALDRAGERRRDRDWVEDQRRHPRARAVVASADGIRVTGGDEPRLALVPLAEAGATGRDRPDRAGAGAGEPLLLGIDDAGPVFATEADGAPVELLGLREAAASLPQADSGLAAYAVSLLGWHRTHRFCANCGAPTEIEEGGHLRRCPACGREHHPRTDPVVIMLVTRGDSVLLGRQARWPPGRYSALAGFVEPGESLEEAVAREVREESGVTVGPPRYVSSQPWPFPSSLMLGFVAPWEAGEPAVGDEELEDVRWFARGDLEAAVAGSGPLRLPPRLAIARRLIDGWLAAAST
jgi:NAD+ diphosphatase